MIPRHVAIVRTRVGNTASVTSAFARIGLATRTIDLPGEVADAQLLVLPGVGAFGAALESLRSRDLVGPLQRRIERGQPTLLICLGLQLLCEASDESPGVAGLGIVRATIGRFREVQPVPQIGWNEVVPDAGAQFVDHGYAYFSNSFRLDDLDACAGWSIATSTFGHCFVAAMERANVLACQFHPELSGPWGLSVLQRWAACVDEGNGARC